MEVSASEQIAEAVAAEYESLSLACRADPERLEQLLAPDFHEFGSSGGEIGYEGTAAQVAAQTDPDGEPISVENMRGWLLADGLVMLKYTSENHGRRSNRTSLWRRAGSGRWQIFHHQGTPRVGQATIVSYDDSPPPPGARVWVAGYTPAVGIEVTDPDPAWPRQYDDLAGRIRAALGWRALQIEHVGSTSVPGLAAKPIIDIDLTVADPHREQHYVPALETVGFRLVGREPWWYGHRLLNADEPKCNLHVFGSDSPELVRHRIFRDWLRGNRDERDRYAAVKNHAASQANAAGEHVMQYNARKEQVLREIYHRAFLAAGLLQE